MNHREAPDDAPPSTPIACPKCRASMRVIRVAEILVDRCTVCGGFWLDALEKERLIAYSRVAELDRGPAYRAQELDDQQRITCPRDRSQMIHLVDPDQPHVGYESCTVCGGVFLDGGELRDLSELTIAERLRRLFR